MNRQMLEPSDSKSVVRRFYAEAINGRDLSAVDRYLTDDFRHTGEARGRPGQRAAIAAFLDGFSDLHHEILIILTEGDLVSAYQRWTGTHDGPFLGSGPSGRVVSFASTAILRLRGNKIAEAWDVVDMALVAQLWVPISPCIRSAARIRSIALRDALSTVAPPLGEAIAEPRADTT